MGEASRWRPELVDHEYAGVPVSVIVVAFAGLVLRLSDVGGLWVDEEITVRIVTEYTYLELLTRLPVSQPHYPPFYLLVRLLTDVSGEALAAARGVSVVAGTLTIIAVYLLTNAYASRHAAVLAAGFTAVSPTLIQISAWARMYSVLALAVVVSWYLLERALHSQTWRAYVAYAASATVVGWLHPHGLIAVVAQFSWLLISHAGSIDDHTWRAWRRPLAVVAGISVVLLPAGLLLVGKFVVPDVAGSSQQLKHVVDPPSVTQAVLTVGASFWGTLWLSPQLVLAAAVLHPLLLVGGWLHRQHRIVRLLAVWIIVPIAFTYAVSHAVKPIYELKYLTWIAPAVIMLAAVLISDGGRRLSSVLFSVSILGVSSGVYLHFVYYALVANFVSPIAEAIRWAAIYAPLSLAFA